MPEVINSPAKELNLFYLIDVSGSMSGSKIQSVNDVMPQAMEIVAKISKDNRDNAVIKASVMTFSDDATWMYPNPVYAEEMVWQDLEADGGTYFGKVCSKLEAALHKEKSKYPESQLLCTVGHKKSAIILISDGEPLDEDWKQQLAILQKNKWFDEASKIAIAIGNDCNKEVLWDFVGRGKEKGAGGTVLEVHNIKDLESAIKIASSVASKVGSQRAADQGNGGSNTQQAVNEAIKEEAPSLANPTQAGAQQADDWD